ncbi:MAG: HlyD family efflux transporter periplasmic adaptor subunit [Kangiellaceae bacterium]|jgi:HlyD family secretion protein|nr:HlyD family efflux transporter periplasmic adaptor subunit [Kangiellaceae bacterium]
MNNDIDVSNNLETKKRHHYKFRLILSVLISVIILSSLMSFYAKPEDEFLNVLSGDFTPSIDTVGLVEAKDPVVVLTRSNGILSSLLVKPGMALTKGDRIATIENPELYTIRTDLERELVNARAKLANSKVRFELESLELAQSINNARSTLESAQKKIIAYKKLLANNVISEIDFEIEKVEYQRLLDEIDYLKSRSSLKLKSNEQEVVNLNREIDYYTDKLNDINDKIDNLTIYAQRDGVVLDISESAEVGTMLSAGDVIAKLYSPRELAVTFRLAPNDADLINTGFPIIVTHNSRSFVGEIVAIDKQIKDGTVRAWAELKQDRRWSFQPNMNLEVSIGLDKIKNTLYVEKDIWLTPLRKIVVYVFDGDEISKRTIELGYSNKKYINIISGLKAGDKIARIN